MYGIRVFPSLAAASAEGFTFHEHRPDAIVARSTNGQAMALAFVKLPHHERTVPNKPVIPGVDK